MIVQASQLANTLEELYQESVYAFDTETTGLRPFQGDRLFSLIIATDKKEYYFNFQAYPGLSPDWVLPRSALKKIGKLFSNPHAKWFATKAPFDLAMLAVEGIEVAGTVHCTVACGRVEKNNRFAYGMDALGKLVGRPKDDTVKAYIKKKQLYRIEGEEKIPCYNQVPLEIIHPYGCSDARTTYLIGMHQIDAIARLATQKPLNKKTPLEILKNERRLTKTCFQMEKTGIRINRAYVERATAHEQKKIDDAALKFKEFTGIEFVDSGKVLSVAFTKMGEKYPLTEKGNPSFTDAILEEFTTPVAQIVRDYRSAAKRCNTYYRNFLKFADSSDILHAEIRQGGTEPGRMSYADPNLQNLPKRKEEAITAEFLIRRSFIPRDGHCFVMLDYDQMEYRLMLEYAKQMDVIEQVKAGLDVHQATANMMGVEREPAKTLNFMLLYGGGVAKLCVALFSPTLPIEVLKDLVRVHFWRKRAEKPDALKALDPQVVEFNLTELRKALDLQELYFSRLPKVKEFTKGVAETAKERGFIRNWAGRICYFADPRFAYAAPNHLIQGGCADVVKFSMNRIDDFLQDKKTKMLVQIHDEILFEIPKSKLGIVPELKGIMESTYPAKFLPLTCGVDHSWKSWADKTEGMPG